MPAWPVHLKIANKLAEKYHYTDDFIIGNVISDTMNGYIIDSPSNVFHHTVTHYSKPDYYDFLDIDTNSFLQCNRSKLNNELLLGTYIHLLTDYYYNEYTKINHFKRMSNNKTLAILNDGTIEENIHPMTLKQNDFINYGNLLIKNNEIGSEVSMTKDMIMLSKDLDYPVEKEDLIKTVDKINEYVNSNIHELNEYIMFTEQELTDLFNNCYKYVDKKIIELTKDKEIAKAFNNYTAKYDMEDSDINYKYYHSYRVMENAKYLAEQLKLSDKDKELATIIGLYHDIGRFEQDKLFDSYKDTKQFDHGDYGEEILIKQELIKDIPIEESYYNIITKSVKLHNKYKIEDNLTKEELFHAKLIRDADKLDIIKYFSEKKFRLKSFDYQDDTFEIRDEIKEEFFKKQTIKTSNKKNINNSEKAVIMIALVFDINFKETAEYILKNKMLDNLYENLLNREKYAEYINLATKHLKELIKC